MSNVAKAVKTAIDNAKQSDKDEELETYRKALEELASSRAFGQVALYFYDDDNCSRPLRMWEELKAIQKFAKDTLEKYKKGV